MQTAMQTETELIAHYQETHSDTAFSELHKIHDKLLKKLFHKFANLLHTGISSAELEQEILIGFHDAVLKFDTARGCKLSTYCYQNISNALLDLYRKQKNQNKKIASNQMFIDGCEDNDISLDLLSSIADPASTHDKFLEKEYYQKIRDYLTIVDDASKNICIDYLYNGMTQGKIVEKYNISKMCVNRIVKKLTMDLHSIIEN